MKYKVGDKVRIKSLDWYEKNKSNRGYVTLAYEAEVAFTIEMSSLCGQIVTISQKTYTQDVEFYRIREDRGTYMWTDEMIEGLVEEETKFGTASKPIEIKSNANCLTRERVDELATKIDKELPSGNQNVWELPDGYQFTDEDGNVINARKIVLEKKKKEYPKTYEECRRIMDIDTGFLLTSYDLDFWKGHLLTSLQKLLICRNAYWKIAGEEMGLGKPWKPSDSNYITGRYCIFVHQGNIICSTPAEDCPFTFPTEEMRGAFYENFKELIEQCKELL